MDPDRLIAIPVFSSLEPEALRQLAAFASEMSVPAGKEIVKEGDYSYDFIAIDEGQADVLRGGKRVATLGPGDFFGEIGVLEKTRRSASVVAASPMRLVVLSHWDLKRAGPVIDDSRATLERRRRENQS